MSADLMHSPTQAQDDSAAEYPVPADWREQHEPAAFAPIIHAVCLALSRPVSMAELATICGKEQPLIDLALQAATDALRGTGLMLQQHAGEVQLVTRATAAWAVARALNPEKRARLSRAATETLAIIAYRQPVTISAIEAIRGVDCSGVIEKLEQRGLISELGREDSPGHPRLFGTTLRFLQTVGLESIADLPRLPETVFARTVFELEDTSDQLLADSGGSDGGGPTTNGGTDTLVQKTSIDGGPEGEPLPGAAVLPGSYEQAATAESTSAGDTSKDSDPEHSRAIISEKAHGHQE